MTNSDRQSDLACWLQAGAAHFYQKAAIQRDSKELGAERLAVKHQETAADLARFVRVTLRLETTK